MAERTFGSLTDKEPRFTTRVTVRNPFFANTGFSYDTTVEVTYECDESQIDETAEAARIHLRAELRSARDEGIRERDARNKIDGR